MKHTLILLCLLGLPAFSAMLPQSLVDTIQTPPNISEGASGGFPVPQGSGVILRGKEFISYLFLESGPSSESAKYTFRTFSTVHKLEIQGRGEVFERYYRVSDPAEPNSNTTVIDRGSILDIDAGIFKITWSAGPYIYLGKGKVKAEAGSEERYLEIIKNEK
jgi:hypothetical protein